MRREKGFTLVELLVVIAIIAVLATIVIPTLTRAMELANQSVCTGNLNGAGKAIQMYMKDENDRTPRLISQGDPNVSKANATDPRLLDTWDLFFDTTDKVADDGTADNVNAMQNVWLLIRKGLLTVGAFKCPSDSDWSERVDTVKDQGGNFDQFGWSRMDQFSYGLHWPYDKDKAGTKTNPAPFRSSLSGSVVIMADRNPVDSTTMKTVTDDEKNGYANPVTPSNHPKDGESYLLMSGQVKFYKVRGLKDTPKDSRAGYNGDDIYVSNAASPAQTDLPQDDTDSTNGNQAPYDTIICPIPSR